MTSNKQLSKIIFIVFIVVFLALIFLIHLNIADAATVPYRIRMADSSYTAQLRGKTGTRTDGLTINGTYSSTFHAHQFNVTIAGNYDLWFDAAGGSNYIKDAAWSGGSGKFIQTGYFDDAIDTDLDYKVDQIDDDAVDLDALADDVLNYIGAKAYTGDTLVFAADTTTLKNVNLTSGHTAYLKQLSATNANGGGFFITIDSTFDESYGGIAFSHPTSGLQWARYEVLQTPHLKKPEWYGAVIDGDTDDSDALNRLSSAMDHGDLIKMPAGDYKITETWYIPAYVTNIIGERNIVHSQRASNNPAIVDTMGVNIMWDGGKDIAVIVGLNANGVSAYQGGEFSNINIIDRSDSGSVGLLVARHSLADFRHLTVAGFDTGYYIGTRGALLAKWYDINVYYSDTVGVYTSTLGASMEISKGYMVMSSTDSTQDIYAMYINSASNTITDVWIDGNNIHGIFLNGTGNRVHNARFELTANDTNIIVAKSSCIVSGCNMAGAGYPIVGRSNITSCTVYGNSENGIGSGFDYDENNIDWWNRSANGIQRGINAVPNYINQFTIGGRWVLTPKYFVLGTTSPQDTSSAQIGMVWRKSGGVADATTPDTLTIMTNAVSYVEKTMVTDPLIRGAGQIVSGDAVDTLVNANIKSTGKVWITFADDPDTTYYTTIVTDTIFVKFSGGKTASANKDFYYWYFP